MLLSPDLDPYEQERATMWELFAQIMDFDPDFCFTAKELAKELPYTKSDLNKLLHRLSINEALTAHHKTPNGTLYSLNPDFLAPPL